MKTLGTILILCSLCQAQDYWTPRRKIETAAVTSLHLADAAQTCYHMSKGWEESGLGTPRNCPGSAVYLVASGPVLQYATYRLTRRYPDSRLWKAVDKGLPHLEIAISVNAIRCSNAGGCRHGF
jgi:hypothetical protein